MSKHHLDEVPPPPFHNRLVVLARPCSLARIVKGQKPMPNGDIGEPEETPGWIPIRGAGLHGAVAERAVCRRGC